MKKGIAQFVLLTAAITGMGMLAMSSADEVKPKSIVKTTKLGVTDVGITCMNAAEPKIRGNYGTVIIVSCDLK